MVTKVDRMIARPMASLIIALAVAGCEGGESSEPTAPTSSVISGSAQQGLHESVDGKSLQRQSRRWLQS
jgi:hypothetical protein